jgi:hypothetical protein
MLNFLQSLFLPCLNKIKVLHLRNRINLNKMKMKICFSLLFFLSAQFYGQDILSQNDTITKLSPVLVNPKKQSPERLPEIKNNTLFS